LHKPSAATASLQAPDPVASARAPARGPALFSGRSRFATVAAGASGPACTAPPGRVWVTPEDGLTPSDGVTPGDGAMGTAATGAATTGLAGATAGRGGSGFGAGSI